MCVVYFTVYGLEMFRNLIICIKPIYHSGLSLIFSSVFFQISKDITHLIVETRVEELTLPEVGFMAFEFSNGEMVEVSCPFHNPM